MVAGFGASADEAAQRARQLAGADPIRAEKIARHAALTRSYLATSDAEYNKALNWAKASAGMFVVEEFGTGIWAGLPWFRDNWGRDTFIALPGTLLVSGQFDQAKAVLSNFARYQNLREPRDKEYGRIPNRVSATERTIYNTVDGTPWMLREALEYIRYTGDKAFAAQMYKLALPYFEGAIANYTDQQGLLSHDSADTWMDARIDNKQPWSARGPRAVEIQALWYTALQTGAALATQAGEQAKAREWTALAAKVQRSFLSTFWDGRVMADRLREDGSRDTKVRPNQLMLVSIPFDDFVPLAVQAKVTRNAVSQLLYPYGIASLSQDDPYFHPRHENPAFHHKDAAYHQGTIWGWNAGFTVTALNKFGYQDLAWPLTQNLGRQILGLGTLGHHERTARRAARRARQTETVRHLRAIVERGRICAQRLPGLRRLQARPAGQHAGVQPRHSVRLDVVLRRAAVRQRRFGGSRFQAAGAAGRWRFRLNGATPRTVSFSFLNPDKSRSQLAFTLAPGKTRDAAWSARARRTLDGRALAVRPAQPSFAGVIGKLGIPHAGAIRPERLPDAASRRMSSRASSSAANTANGTHEKSAC